MPSPFPGMNPYLEHPYVWSDFHQSYITFLRSALAAKIPSGYFVQVQEQLYLREANGDERRFLGISDANLVRRPSGGETTAGTATTTAPVTVTLPELVEQPTYYFEVVDRKNRRVVTVIELLSQSNKLPGEDRDDYLRKRQSLLQRGVNVVELDFLRAGGRLPMDGLPACDYSAMVARAATRPKADTWPIALRDPLPSIPIPLEPTDGDVMVDLQAVLHRLYDEANYDRSIYDDAPQPPLPVADAAWAEGIVRTATESRPAV